MKSANDVSLTIILTVLSSSTLYASPNNKSNYVDKKVPQEVYKEIDTNNDAKISFEELNNYMEQQKYKALEKDLSQNFYPCDKNQDGNISLGELEKVTSIKARSNSLKNTKFCKLPSEAFDDHDLNDDKLISFDELKVAMTRGFRPKKSLRQRKEEMRHRYFSKIAQKHFTVCDSDENTLLSLRELVSINCKRITMFTEIFDAYDTNKDNFLSIEELQTFQEVPLEKAKGNHTSLKKSDRKISSIQRLRSILRECDENNDGLLGKKEIISEGCEIESSYFDSVDYHQDGTINYQDIDRIQIKRYFQSLDKDNNDYLENEEFISAGVRFN